MSARVSARGRGGEMGGGPAKKSSGDLTARPALSLAAPSDGRARDGPSESLRPPRTACLRRSGPGPAARRSSLSRPLPGRRPTSGVARRAAVLVPGAGDRWRSPPRARAIAGAGPAQAA